MTFSSQAHGNFEQSRYFVESYSVTIQWLQPLVMGGVSWIFGVMFKVCSEEIFSDSASPKTLFSSCNHLILAHYQIIRAEWELYYQLLLAEKCDVIKLSRLVNQFATGSVSPSNQELVIALSDISKASISRTLKNMEAKGLISVGRTPGGKAEYLNLTRKP